jgi:hypothetical protein
MVGTEEKKLLATPKHRLKQNSTIIFKWLHFKKEKQRKKQEGTIIMCLDPN